jgi:hypothetical protein
MDVGPYMRKTMDDDLAPRGQMMFPLKAPWNHQRMRFHPPPLGCWPLEA